MTSRWLSLGAALLASLSAGTQYAVSNWAPQVATKLGLSMTELSFVMLGGSVAGTSTLIWGYCIEQSNNKPKRLLLCAAALLWLGHALISLVYGWSDVGHHTAMLLLGLGYCLANVGGAGAFSIVLNVTAKNFVTAQRGTTSGLVISGLGLSALMYASLGHVLGNSTASFLRLLTWGTSISVLIASFGVAVVPIYTPRQTAVRPFTPPLATPSVETSFGTPLKMMEAPRKLSVLRDRTFLAIVGFLGLCGGIGVCWISNVGSVAQALFTFHTSEYDHTALSMEQSSQVVLLSFMNWIGRLSIGLVSDLTLAYGFPRTYWAVLIAAMFVLSQITASRITEISGLHFTSMLLGTAYGAMYGLLPTIVCETFGLQSFAYVWGWTAMSTVPTAPVFNVLFGHVYDLHAEASTEKLTRRAFVGQTKICLLGNACFRDTFRLTTLASLIALALSIYLARHARNREI